MKKIAVGDLGEFWYADYKEPFEQLEGGVPGHPVGVLLKDDDGKVLCAFCGETFDSLAQHVKHHGMTARDYKREVGIPQKGALVSEKVRLNLTAASLKATGLGTTRERLLEVGAAGREARRLKGYKRGLDHAAYTPEILNKTGRCRAQVTEAARTIARSGPLTQKKLAKIGIGERLIERYFGSIENLRRELGAEPRPGWYARWTKPRLIAALRALAVDLGRTPSQSDLNRFGLPGAATYGNHFGTYVKACEAAGLVPHTWLRVGDEPIDMAAQILVAYATTGTVAKTARACSTSDARVRDILTRYGVPALERSGHGGTKTTERRAWAAEMARRLVAA